jgi:hypothetical protein
MTRCAKVLAFIAFVVWVAAAVASGAGGLVWVMVAWIPHMDLPCVPPDDMTA